MLRYPTLVAATPTWSPNRSLTVPGSSLDYLSTPVFSLAITAHCNQPCKGELNNLFSSGVILRSKHVLALAFQSASGAAAWVPGGFCETL